MRSRSPSTRSGGGIAARQELRLALFFGRQIVSIAASRLPYVSQHIAQPSEVARPQHVRELVGKREVSRTNEARLPYWAR